MEVLRALCIFMTCISNVQTYPIEHDINSRQVTRCLLPQIQLLNGILVPDRPMPRKDYKNALRKEPNGREINAMIRQTKEELGRVADLEKEFDKNSALCFPPLCKSRIRVITNWRVLGTDCWAIQPVIWRQCKEKPLDAFSCVNEMSTTGLGYTCQSEYMPVTVLVYCQHGVPAFRYMSVYVSFKCSLKKYCCQNI
ncbi:uncharacterized protein LOC132758797 [Ruditapes philippinarum]|uniref:uncharacterized protein LOC132758797 n=1 Tax=Ruditapes philippinarum TaxID=129788 RepID=UPI00295B350E|nr:uncharacterized protein LOC132758797 [Ruditapes philippinarum]